MNVSMIAQSASAIEPTPPPTRTQARRSRATVRRILAAAIVIAVALSLPAFVQGFYVQGTSMVPTLHPGQLVLVNKAAAWREDLFGPGRGDFVVFDAPTAPGHDFVKRVIGLPGDRILVDADRVSVNDVPLGEPYVVLPGGYTYPADGHPLTVPDDSYFVLGDNRPASADSHLGWVVPANHLVGQGYPLPWLSPATTAVVPDASELIPGPVQQAEPARPAVAHDASSVTAPDPESAGAQPGDAPEPPVVEPGITLPSSWTLAHVNAQLGGGFVALGISAIDVPNDVAVSASFRKEGGPPGGSYGLILRNQSPSPLDGHTQSGNYYVLEASDRGEIGVWRREGDRWVDLVSWTHSEAVHAGGGGNDLTALAVGDHLTLLVNGVIAANVRDTSLTAGGIGVFVGGEENDVAVERLAVRAPTDHELAQNSSSAEPAPVSKGDSPTLATPAPEPRTEPVAQSRAAVDALPPLATWAPADVSVQHAGQFVAFGSPDVLQLRNVTVSATFRKVSGPPGGGYGLILRDKSSAPLDGQNQSGSFYVLGAGDAGDVGVWRRDGERWIDLLPWTHSAAVLPGPGTNELTARALGDQLTLTVNGIEVANLTDAALAEGGVGVFVGGDGNHVAIDHFVVR